VWEEMPSAYRFTSVAVERVTREWTAVIERDRSHPCIAAWVPVNESWGVPDLSSIEQQRSYVQALYHLTRTLDGTRPVVGNDGWESVATDILGIHYYDDDLIRLALRYATDEALPRLFRRERPGGRTLALPGYPHAGQPIILSEFGGIALANDQSAQQTWGYTLADTPEELASRFAALMRVIQSLALLAGYAYTQFTDTYQEANGLLTMDRVPKIPVQEVNRANRSSQVTREDQLQHMWEERMQAFLHEVHARSPEGRWVESADYAQVQP
jgi:Glycosyl hydrolases family 2, TIM barrel domain